MTELGAVREELAELKKLLLQVVGRAERPRLYEFKEAARLLGVDPRTVSRMVASGELFPVSIRGKRLIPVEEIDRVSRPPAPKTSGAAPERRKYDAAAALRRMAELRAQRKD